MTNLRTAPSEYEPENDRLKTLLSAAHQFESQAMRTTTVVAGGFTLATTTWFQTVLANEDFIDLRRAISIGLICGLISLGLSLLLPFVRSRESLAGYGAIFSKNVRMLNRGTLEEAIEAKNKGAENWGYDNNEPIDIAIGMMRNWIAQSMSQQSGSYFKASAWRWTKVFMYLLTISFLLTGLGIVALGVYVTGVA